MDVLYQLPVVRSYVTSSDRKLLHFSFCCLPSCSMVGQKGEDSSQPMIDVTYRQSAADRDMVAVLQKLYLCASVEFLMAVTDFFLQALPQSLAATAPPASGEKLPLRHTAEPRADSKAGETRRPGPGPAETPRLLPITTFI